MNTLKILLIGLFGALLLYSCGDPEIDVTEAEYESKISVEGYIYPEQPVRNIKIRKNFPLNTSIDTTSLALKPDVHSAKVSINGVDLEFNSANQSYYSNDLQIHYDSTYTLRVSARVSGEELYTESTTRTPKKGFSLVNDDLGNINYTSETPVIEYQPSPETETYAFSVIADSASVESFIYGNPYEPNPDKDHLKESFNVYRYQLLMVINVDSNPSNVLYYELRGYDTWFYGPYTVTVYACDKNMKDYLLTAENVQEMDGNFLEPEMHLKGDGIGIFGSAIKDTLKFTIE